MASFTDNLSAEKIVELIRPFVPLAWTQWFSGYGTYAIGGAMLLSGVAPALGLPLPWVPLGTEGQWIAAGIATFTIRRAIGNKEKNILSAIQENTEITKTASELLTTAVKVTK